MIKVRYPLISLLLKLIYPFIFLVAVVSLKEEKKESATLRMLDALETIT